MFDLIMISIFMFISVTIIIISCIVIYNIKKNCSVEVTAVVEKNELHHNYNSHRNYRKAILGYDYNGVHYTTTARTKSGNKEVGSLHKIKLNPKNPQKNYQKDDLFIPYISLIIGIQMTCISMFYGIKIFFDIFF